MQTRDREQMREPRAGITFPDLRIELGAPRDDQCIHERCAGAKQPAAAVRDAITQRSPPARHGVQFADATRHEKAARNIAEKSAGDDPCRAAVRGVSVGPANGESAAAAAAAHQTFGDATGDGDGIGELDSHGARNPGACPLSNTRRALLTERGRAPQGAGNQHEGERRGQGSGATQQQRANQHAPRRNTQLDAVQRDC